jgi:hypothetical protein
MPRYRVTFALVALALVAALGALGCGNGSSQPEKPTDVTLAELPSLVEDDLAAERLPVHVEKCWHDAGHSSEATIFYWCNVTNTKTGDHAKVAVPTYASGGYNVETDAITSWIGS